MKSERVAEKEIGRQRRDMQIPKQMKHHTRQQNASNLIKNAWQELTLKHLQSLAVRMKSNVRGNIIWSDSEKHF